MIGTPDGSISSTGGGSSSGNGGVKISYVKRGVELISTLDSLLAEGSNADHGGNSSSGITSTTGRRIKKLHLRTDLAEYITRTLIGLEELANEQQNAKAQHTMENIQQRLEQVTSLHLYSPPSSLDLHFFKISYYRALEELVLEDCPPSLAIDLYLLRKCLFKIKMVQSGITCLADVLAPVKHSIRQSLSPMILTDTTILSLPKKYYWRNMTSLTLSNCGLSRIDEALHFFPALTYLNLSNNAITHITHLHDCIALQTLDLSCNKIRVLSNLERVLGKLKVLILNSNEIESIDGIDRIYSLEILDIANNMISDVNEMQHVCRLPCLEAIYLLGNPLCEKKHYRLRVYREFLKIGSIMSGNRQFPTVDGKEIRKKELKKLRRLLFRAPTDSMVESSYASHYSPYMDIDFDELEDETFEDSEIADSQDYIDFRPTSSRLSIGAVSPLASDAFRRLSTVGRTRSTATSVAPSFSPNKRNAADRRSSLERMRSSEYFGQGSPLGGMSGRQSSVVVKRFQKKPSTRKKRMAEIVTGEVKDVYPSLSEIEEDMMKHPELWKKHDPVPPSSAHDTISKSESMSVCSDSASAATSPNMGVNAMNVMNSPKRDHPGPLAVPVETGNHGGSSLPGSLELPSTLESSVMPGSPLPSPSRGTGASFSANPNNAGTGNASSAANKSPLPTMDAFIGRINENTEFKGYATSPLPSSSSAAANAGTSASVNPQNQLSEAAAAAAAAGGNGSDEYERPSLVGGRPSMYAGTSSNNVGLTGNRESVVGRESIISRISDLPYDAMGFHRQASQDSVLLEVDPYVGDAQYRTLSVLDNLELYFREQVFPSNRPSFPNLYLREKPTSPNDHSLRLITPYAPEERFITLFFEKVIDLKDPLIPIKSSYNLEDDVAGMSIGGGGKASAGGASGSGVNASGTSGGNNVEYEAKETYVALVLTDMGFYVIDLTDVTPKIMFSDSPLLSVQKHHPLYKLSLCTIYFGFQRCALGFFEDPYQSDIRSVSDMMAAYMIVTRDKSHTYPIITRMPQVANIQRNARKPKALSNVRIENKDGQLLEQVTRYLGNRGDNDINHYQMVYQVNTKRPGWKAPRSIVLTKSMLLLCSEDLNSVNVKLQVLDSSQLKDVFKIYHEENPLFVTFVFKRTGVLSTKRKWRVFCDARQPSAKLLEECRQACQSVGNMDV